MSFSNLHYFIMNHCNKPKCCFPRKNLLTLAPLRGWKIFMMKNENCSIYKLTHSNETLWSFFLLIILFIWPALTQSINFENEIYILDYSIHEFLKQTTFCRVQNCHIEVITDMGNVTRTVWVRNGLKS